jgi:O-methyltransferase involved in polyketide biosynthesis
VLPRPTYIAADLARVPLEAALAGSRFQPGKRTLFTCEGLIYYLPQVGVWQ